VDHSKSLSETEKLGAEGATHPRITLDYIKSQIDQFATFTLDDALEGIEIARAVMVENKALVVRMGHGRAAEDVEVPENTVAIAGKTGHLTICVMVLKSGFIVIGKSAPLSPENFDADKGATFAYEDCIRQCWPLFAFAQLQSGMDGAAREDDGDLAVGR
jgi:hypothetical protein